MSEKHEKEACSDSSDEEEILLDESGRVPIGGEMDYSFRAYNETLSPSVREVLREEAIKVCKVDDGGGTRYSTGETYWVPCDADPSTLTGLENLALSIFKTHTAGAIHDRSKSGAEWWTVVVEENDEAEVTWHFDKDYDLERSGINVFPHLSTVTYLTDCGAPTVILEHAGPMRTSDKIETEKDEIKRCWVCYPKMGRHCAFDGRFLHAAPSALAVEGITHKRKRGEDEKKRKSLRVTFLVNVWLSHTVSGDKLDISKFRKKQYRFDRTTPISLEQVQSSEGVKELAWEFGEAKGEDTSDHPDGEEGSSDEEEYASYEVRARLPTNLGTKSEGVFAIDFAIGYGATVSLAPGPGEEDDDGE